MSPRNPVTPERPPGEHELKGHVFRDPEGPSPPRRS